MIGGITGWLALFPAASVAAGVLYVQDGRVITSAGSAAGLDMLLHLVRSDYGSAIANQVAQRLVIPAHRDGDQAQLVERPLPTGGGERIAPLMDWVREHLRSPHTVESMAQRSQMSRRSFQRKFKAANGLSPLDWLVRERVALAVDLLESRPGLATDMVAELAGFGSGESMRHHFRRLGRASPARLRRESLRPRVP